jgi:hypothetical protein
MYLRPRELSGEDVSPAGAASSLLAGFALVWASKGEGIDNDKPKNNIGNQPQTRLVQL